MQQLTAEQIGDVQEETVEVVKTALEERNSERSEAIKVPKISRDTVISLMPAKCRGCTGLAAYRASSCEGEQSFSFVTMWTLRDDFFKSQTVQHW